MGILDKMEANIDEIKWPSKLARKVEEMKELNMKRNMKEEAFEKAMKELEKENKAHIPTMGLAGGYNPKFNKMDVNRLSREDFGVKFGLGDLNKDPKSDHILLGTDDPNLSLNNTNPIQNS
jgi:hypothetical protein